MRNIKTVASILAISAILSGCADMSGPSPFTKNTSHQTADLGSQYPKTEPKNIILATNTPKCAYKNVGFASANTLNLIGMKRSFADVKADLQEDAAKMGGNAVIELKPGFQTYDGTVVYIQNIKKCSLQRM